MGDWGGGLQDRTAERALATRPVVRLLRSCMRTFLCCLILANTVHVKFSVVATIYMFLFYYHPHPKDGEGNVFTGVCLPTGGVLHGLWSQVPSPVSGPRTFPGYTSPVTGPAQSPVLGPARGDPKFRVSTASGNQGKLEGIFPVREKSGNLAFCKKKSGNFDDTIFFLYFDNTIYFHGCKGRITAGCVSLRYLYSELQNQVLSCLASVCVLFVNAHAG